MTLIVFKIMVTKALNIFNIKCFLQRLLILLLLVLQDYIPVNSQYFGRNKPGYETFKYDVYRTPHFDIYHNFKNDSLINDLASYSEQWYEIHSTIFDDSIRFRNPVIFYETHADFQQTNVTNSTIGVGTGGFTEGLKNRVVMPVSTAVSQTDHVLGHELVHAFQYNLLLNSDSLSLKNISNIPLWMIEGMAEYISIGSVDPYTSMWIRDAYINKEFPTLSDMTKKPKYNPYRYGQAFWTFTSKIWGDTVMAPLLVNTARLGYKKAVETTLGVDEKSFSNMWKSATELHYKSVMKDSVDSLVGRKFLSEANAGDYNLSPVISPDGKYVAFLSEKNVFTIDLFLADVEKGKVISKLSSTVKNDEIDAFNFIESSGSWSPDSRKFAYVAFIHGQNKLIIINVKKRKIIEEISIPGIKSFNNPAWSPDGNHIAFSGLSDGINNLYLYNINTGEVKQLTSDKYSYLHPSWSPDGKYLVCATDKNQLQNAQGTINNAFDIAIINLKNGKIEVLDIFTGAGNLNPVFSSDGESIYFISDRDGFRNLYKHTLSGSNTYQLTDYLTGISGITLLSPAISVSEKNQVVYSYYHNQKYDIYIADEKEFNQKEVDAHELNFDAATLAPLKRVSVNLVDSLHSNRPIITYDNKSQYKPVPYKPRFKLDYISNASVGVAVGRFGTGMAGSVSALFSDMVGDNQIFASIALNGEIYDFGGQVAYLNQKKRINWGAAISHIPYMTGYLNYKTDTLNIDGEAVITGNYYMDILRIFETKASIFSFLPISTTRRIEAGLSAARYGYRFDRYNNYYSIYGKIGESRERLEAPGGFNLLQTDIAYVFDNSYFGVTSPMQGRRSRYQLVKYFGKVNYFSTLVDYRKYFFINPVSLAFRFYNNNRIGGDAENNIISPLYLGYSWLIRGYDGTSSKNTGNPEVNSISINQLIGTRMVVTNAEIRIPLFGPENLSLIKSKYLYTDLALFVDGGLIWDSHHMPEFKWQSTSDDDRIPLFSTGASIRVNIFGYLVIEPFYAFPLQNGGFKNGAFGINFVPGW
jgi:Tol biopolymer transport system component